MSAQNGRVASNTTRRWRWLAGTLGGFLAVAVGFVAYWAQVLRYHQTTDDAYVGGNVVQITPQISGTVIGLGADDTQFVKAGQALVRLDQADARVALDQAEAQLARTVRDVRNLFATRAQLGGRAQQRPPRARRAAAPDGPQRRAERPRPPPAPRRLRRGLGRGTAARDRCGQGCAGGAARRAAAARRQTRPPGGHGPPG